MATAADLWPEVKLLRAKLAAAKELVKQAEDMTDEEASHHLLPLADILGDCPGHGGHNETLWCDGRCVA